MNRKTNRMGEMVVNHTFDQSWIQNIQTTQTTEKKTNYPIKKMGKRPEQTFLKRRHPSDQ
jgi:hypothetical protein